jgi:hypothetical protein
MSSTSLVRSGYPEDWPGAMNERRRRGGFSRFLLSVAIGVGGTLAWQSYGDDVRDLLASTYPQLAFLAPTVRAPAPAPRPQNATQDIQALANNLAAMRQRLDQLAVQIATSQDQVSRDLTAKVQAAQRDILDRIAAAPPPRPQDAPPARRPASTSLTAPQVR